MFPQMLLALLSDASGKVLLVRRKDSLLWTLPGCVIRESVASRSELLAGCCRRQIGITPDFVAHMVPLAFSGQFAAIGLDQVTAERVRACGRVAESGWFLPDALPSDLAPIASLAVATYGPQTAAVALAEAC